MNIRSAQAEDAAALAEIYQIYVYKGLMTFDELPPDAAAHISFVAVVMMPAVASLSNSARM